MKELKLSDPIEVNIVEQNRKDLESYAEEIISNRAVVSIYGFKPVHMLLVYCAYATTKITNKTKKCARLVGDMLGYYHPHGDVSTYDSLLTLVNWYDCYIPIFKKQGNFGSFQGDGPAAYRYTETALTEFAMDCIIGDLTKTNQVVDWIKNYDESILQPLYLPLKVPLLLINGTEGIAIGMKADIPSHNINEVIDATLNLLDDPSAPVILRPDHCMPCQIVNANWKAISNNGYGTYVVRSIIESGDYRGYPALFIKSLPNKTRLDPIKQDIEELKFTQLPQIIGVYEDCTASKVNLIVKFKKGTNLEYAKDILYKKTNLQKSFRVNFEVYDPNSHEVVRLSYKAYLQFFIEFRKSTLFRLYASLYQELVTKLHSLDCYIQLSNNKWLDSIIECLRHNKNMNNEEFVEYLIAHYSLTDAQALFILHCDISKLSPYNVEIFKEESYKLNQLADQYYKKIIDENELIKDIREDLIKIKEKYGCPRRCSFINVGELNGIPEGTFKIIVTEEGFLCKFDSESGKFPTIRNDKPKMVIKVENSDNIIIFDNKGKSFKLPVHKIPIYDGRSNGIDVRVLIKELTSGICTVIPESKIKELSKRIDKPFFLTVVSKKGFIKKMELIEFLTVSTKGSGYIKLDEDDIVQDLMIIPNTIDIIVYSRHKAIRYPMDEVPLQKKTSKGLKAMDSEEVDGISIITSNTTDIVVITDIGYINRFPVEGLMRSTRGKAGSRVIKLHKGDFIKVIYGVSKNDSLRVITNTTDGTYPIIDIPEASSVSPGTHIIPVREIVLKCTVIKNK